MLGTIWGNDPPELLMGSGGGGVVPVPPTPVYSNPRVSVYFNDYPPEIGFINDLTEYNILVATLRKGQFSPNYGGPPANPPSTGWRGDAHQPLIWDGPGAIKVKIELIVSLGRQSFQQVDAELFVKQNGNPIVGGTTITSLSRAPTGFHGTSTMILSLYTDLNVGDTIEPLLKRTGFNPTGLTQINVFSAEVNITALSTQLLPIVAFP